MTTNRDILLSTTAVKAPPVRNAQLETYRSRPPWVPGPVTLQVAFSDTIGAKDWRGCTFDEIRDSIRAFARAVSA